MASSVMAACELEFVGEVETRSMRSPVLTACEPAEAIVGLKRETNESNSKSEEEKRSSAGGTPATSWKKRTT